MEMIERFRKIADLKSTIKSLQSELEAELDQLSNADELGLLEEFETDGSYVVDDIRCTPVTTTRWSYPKETKEAIKRLQEMAQYNGDAVATKSTSYRFTF